MSYRRLKCLVEESDSKLINLGRDQIGIQTKTKFSLARIDNDHLQIIRTISSKGVVGGFQLQNN